MKVKRGKASLVGLGEKMMEIAEELKKNSKIRLFARKFRPIYCKYLHVEWKKYSKKEYE